MKEKEKKEFLEDFKKADIQKKLDMWFYSLDQIAIWEEILTEISNIAQMKILKKKV